MESMIQYLGQMPDLHKVFWLALCLSATSVLEVLIPLSRDPYPRWQHFRVNLPFLSTSMVINSMFSLLLVKILPVLAAEKIGLFFWFDLPIWLELLATLLVLDLLAKYTIHVLLHRIGWMWRFHMIHHMRTQPATKSWRRFRHHCHGSVDEGGACL